MKLSNFYKYKKSILSTLVLSFILAIFTASVYPAIYFGGTYSATLVEQLSDASFKDTNVEIFIERESLVSGDYEAKIIIEKDLVLKVQILNLFGVLLILHEEPVVSTKPQCQLKLVTGVLNKVNLTTYNIKLNILNDCPTEDPRSTRSFEGQIVRKFNNKDPLIKLKLPSLTVSSR
jgi:hypothetical protein